MGFPDTAIEDFSAVLRHRPEDADTYLRRGIAYQQIHDSYNAIKDCTKSIRLKSENPEAYRIRGLAYLSRRLYERAIADLEQSKNQSVTQDANVDQQLRRAYVRWSRILAAAADHTKAEEMMEKAKQIRDDVGGEQVVAASFSKDDNEALRSKEAASRLKAGKELLKTGDHSGALDEFTKAIAAHPNMAAAHEMRAKVWLKRHFAENAFFDVQDAIRIAGYSAERYCLKAESLLAMGDNYGAAAAAGEVMRRNPGDARPFALRGMAYLRRDMINEAIRDLSYAIERDSSLKNEVQPALAEAYFQRGKTFERANRLKEAQADFDCAKELGWTVH
jgi:tetratricopeptide (TPR) repeat protein